MTTVRGFRDLIVLITGGIVSGCSPQSTSAEDRPEGQAPVANYTDLGVRVLTPEGEPIPGAQVVVRVFAQVVTTHQLLIGSGLSDALGAYRFSRAAALGGWFPTTITLTAPVGSGLRDTTLTDSTQWVQYPAVARTLSVTLRRN